MDQRYQRRSRRDAYHRKGRLGSAQAADQPPSIEWAAPLMARPASEASSTAIEATSSGTGRLGTAEC